MKKIIYSLFVLLVVVSGFVFATRTEENKVASKVNPAPLTAQERAAALKQWETTPGGIMYRQWEMSVAGKKVYAAEGRIRKHIKDFTGMEGTVTSLSLPAGSKVGFGMMVNIDGEDYILSFGPEKSSFSFLNFSSEFKQLRELKVNDRIVIKSRVVSHAPKYAYPIITVEYVQKDGEMIYKRAPQKGGC